MPHPFFTIGHSTRSVPEFVELLRSAEVRLVVDVRTVPRSRTNPQFNRDVLPESLTAYQIAYEHIAELGGLRGRQRLAEPSPNGFWKNGSFPELCRLRALRKLRGRPRAAARAGG